MPGQRDSHCESSMWVFFRTRVRLTNWVKL